MKTGIYKIESILKPERFYIGSAGDIECRWRLHLRDLNKKKHHSKKLQRHYDKYGVSDLCFSIITGCDKDELLKQEQFFIDSYAPYFNTAMVAGSPKGVKHSDEARKKKSEAFRGDTHPLFGTHPSKTTIQKLIDSHKGKKHSDETKRKMSEARKGRIFSEETRRKLSLSRLGNKNPMYGRTFSQEERIKLSIGMRLIRAKQIAEKSRGKLVPRPTHKLNLTNYEKNQPEKTILAVLSRVPVAP